MCCSWNKIVLLWVVRRVEVIKSNKNYKPRLDAYESEELVVRLTQFAAVVVSISAAVLLNACGGGGSEDDDEQSWQPPSPFFEKPFASNFPVTNLFDHDLPFLWVDDNGHMFDHAGTRRNVGEPGAYIDGHSGYDWIMPEGTSLKAVAAGEVVRAEDVMFPCPTAAGLPVVVQKLVQIQHTAPNGDFYLSRYLYLSTLAVSVGDLVNAGQIIGLSGKTGCTESHFHFQVYRWLGSRGEWVTVDPYGWTGAYPDPWSQHPEGAASSPLWIAGQVPTLILHSPTPPSPFLEKPFDSDFLVGNLFDHDLPFPFVDNNGYSVDHDGTQRSIGAPGVGYDGHAGHDWYMLEGTDLKAVADGQVVVAGEVSGPCPLFSNVVVAGKVVQIQHTASNGSLYRSVYGHLSTIAVSVGDTVNGGQNIGVSGNTGCSSAPHLHFQVYRWLDSRLEWVTVDPYGWTGAYPDPWSEHPDGATSYQLWKAGLAPTLIF